MDYGYQMCLKILVVHKHLGRTGSDYINCNQIIGPGAWCTSNG